MPEKGENETVKIGIGEKSGVFLFGPGGCGRSVLDTRYLAPLVCLLVALGMISWIDHQRKAAFHRYSDADIPKTIGEWTGSDLILEPEVASMLSADVTIYRQYRHPDGREIELFFVGYNFQGEGKTMHSPRNCLPAAGWDLKEKGYVEMQSGFQARYLLMSYGTYRMETIYWFVAGDDVVGDEFENKWKTLWNSMISGRSDGAMISISSVCDSTVPLMRDDLKVFADKLTPYACAHSR